MSVILNFNLSYLANNINSIVCLFDPSPPFQYGMNTDGTYSILSGSQLTRNSNIASAGFAASEIAQVSLNGGLVSSPVTSPINLPSNSYVINVPSQVYGSNPASDTYSVLQINTLLAQVEPGFSRLQVTYQTYNATNNTFKTVTEYFDCPFYEGWDVTAQELNNIANYVEGAVAFLQKEIDVLSQEVNYALSRELWRGTSVSGQISVIQATEGLQTGALARNEFSHSVGEKAIDNPDFVINQSYYQSAAFGTPSSATNNYYGAPGTLTQVSGVSTFYGGMPPTAGNGQTIGSNLGVYVSQATDSNGRRCLVVVTGQDYYDNADLSGLYAGITLQTPSGSLSNNTTLQQASLGYVTYVRLYNPVLGNMDQKFANMNASSISGLDTQYWINLSSNVQSGGDVGYLTGNSQAFSQHPVFQMSDTSGGNNFPGYYTISTDFYHYGDNTPAAVTNYVSQNGGGFPDALTDLVSVNGTYFYRSIIYVNNNVQVVNVSAYEEVDGNPGYLDSNGSYRASSSAVSVGSLNLVPVGPTNPPTLDSSASQVAGCVNQSIQVVGNNFSAQYDSGYIGGIPAAITVNSDTRITMTIPPNAPIGPTTLQVSDGVHSPATINFTVNGQPSIYAINPTQAPPGSPVTITGTNFGSQDGNSAVYFGSQAGDIVSWSNTSITANVPTNNIGLGPTTLAVNTGCGESAQVQFSVSNPDKVVISPHVATVPEETTYQFDAVFFAGTQQTDVSSSNATTWSVNGTVGGEPVHGTINQSGLYTAPSSNPPDVITVTAQYFDSNKSTFLSDSATITLSPQPVITLSPANVNLASGQNQQYQVTLTVNGVETDVTNSSVYSVNDTIGGDLTDGTISSSGLYNAPNNLTSDTSEQITASYVYNGTTLVANATAIVAQAATEYASITVVSQINVYLGDGRFGYIPTGTQIIAYPNQYVYVQFQEQLDNQFHLPIASYLPIQQLAMNVKNALDSDIANVIYNQGSSIIQSDGTTLTTRTVVLGIIDPSDGRWHSMWDIGNPLPGPTVGGHSFNPKELFGDKVRAFSNQHTFKGSLVDYINDISGGAQSQLDSLINKTNVLLAGNCTYEIDTNNFKILDSLHILGISGENSYGIIGVIPKQEIKVEANQYLYIDMHNTLRVGNFSDIFLGAKDTATIFVGAVLDKFYTSWPLLKLVDVDTSHVGDFGDNSYARVGPLLVQWGLTETLTVNKKSAISNKVEFPVAFDKSCVVLTEPFGSSGGFPQSEVEPTPTKEDFKFKLINTGSTNISSKISWMAIGM